jgi:hypothetical protein
MDLKRIVMYLTRFIFLCLLLLNAVFIYAQGNAGIGTMDPNPRAVLELVSKNNNQGFLVPRLTTAQRGLIDSLTMNEKGLLVFDTDVDHFYFWSGSGWMPINQYQVTAEDVIEYDSLLELSELGGMLASSRIVAFDSTVNAVVDKSLYELNDVSSQNAQSHNLLRFNGSSWVPTQDLTLDEFGNLSLHDLTQNGVLVNTNIASVTSIDNNHSIVVLTSQDPVTITSGLPVGTQITLIADNGSTNTAVTLKAGESFTGYGSSVIALSEQPAVGVLSNVIIQKVGDSLWAILSSHRNSVD